MAAELLSRHSQPALAVKGRAVGRVVVVIVHVNVTA